MKIQHFFVFLSLSIITLLFHNCGQFTSDGRVTASSKGCTPNMHNVFKKTYHNFFTKNKCSQCHSPAGISGIPHFAGPDSTIALDFFNRVGPAIVRSKLRGGHQGYNFGNLEPFLNVYEDEWDEVEKREMRKCAINDQSVKISFFEDEMRFGIYFAKEDMLDWQEAVWSLDDRINPNIREVQVSLKIKVMVDDFLKPEGYLVDDLRIKTPIPLRVKSVTVLLNGQTYTVSVYQGVNTEIAPSENFQPLAPGAAGGLFVKNDETLYENADEWSLRFELLEEIKE